MHRGQPPGRVRSIGLPKLTNVTVSGVSGLAGAGIFNNSGTPNLINVTLSENSSVDPGGGIYSTVPISLTNTIVANSPLGGNCSGTFGGNENFSSDNTCDFGLGRDNINVLTLPLGNYTGPTLTYIPFLLSPAIDFGTTTGCPLMTSVGCRAVWLD